MWGLKKNLTLKNKFLVFFAVCFVNVLLFSTPLFAASSTENSDSEKGSELSFKLPSKKRTYFYKIDENILKLIEEGSPSSIKEGVFLIRQNASSLEDNEKVLVEVATNIMKVVYPSQPITWESFSVSADNPYIGALNSVEQGIFDQSTGNVDFLSIVLPTLIITKKNVSPQNFPACENSLKMALSVNKESTLANYLMGILKSKQNKTIEAEYYLQKAYTQSDKNEDIAIDYAQTLRLNGKLTQATTVLSEISSDNSALAILKQNAYIAFDSKDLPNAELYVAKVLQQTPNDLEFVLFRAKILIEKKDYIHAVSLLDMYARHDNSSIEYLIMRAKVQLDWSKNTAAATETVEKALQLYPENIDALMFAAKISSITDSPVAGKYADELAAMVLKSQGENTEAMIYALDGLTQRENWSEAYQISKKLINADDVTPETVEKYVSICIAMNKGAEAYDVAKRFYDKSPNDEVLLQSYIKAYCEVGSTDAVLKYINSLMNNASPKMKSYLYYRRSYLQHTEENILADLRSSLISNPRNSDALFRLYEVYFGKKDYRKAQYYLRQVVAINPNDNSMKKLNEALTKLIN